ncbi:cytochrome c [Halomonas piscis]|uniref:Cytochrome c n=1 Tax=Halomonas piscis TaxID=3031727 RepID=A0ABY9Z2J5_9GAMM|nr:cytochrome c [Halomonas piscis]WNK21348.1 cytochrome c [Halomonas piscis]
MTQRPSKRSRPGSVAGIRYRNFDPYEAYNPIPWQVTAILLALAVWGTVALLTDSQLAEPPPQIGEEAEQAAVEAASSPSVNGQRLFTAYCSTCHQANGAGVKGAVPPLNGSHYVLADAEVPVNILLHGLDGEIEVSGSVYNGRMPTFGHQLSDEQIAAILTHVRGQWDNQAAGIEPDFVAEQRERFSGRVSPWEGGKALEDAFGVADTASPAPSEEDS